MNEISPSGKDGIVFYDVEDTIKHIDKLVQGGLKDMDATILDIILSK